ncbi:MAG TPA: hypothetical protein VHR55_00320 [Candidatus Limnocylindria bacterium]|nr:hypothetical protein [Candidatus Limnocylindria bacterium]
MLNLLGWDVGMSTLAALLLVLGAVLIGLVSFLIGEVRTGWEAPIVALAALVGGYIGSEALGTLSTWGYEFEGLYVWPAIIGAIVLGGAADLVTRYLTGGSYVRHPQPI